MTRTGSTIDRVDIYKLNINRSSPFRISLGTWTHVENILVRVHTSDGFYGLGEASPIPYIVGETQAMDYEAATALAHLLIGTGLYRRYVKDLKKGMNRFRWYEYSVSASIMIVAIAMLTGIYDISALLLVFFMNMMMILFGLRMEVHNQGKKRLDWAPFVMGCIAGAIP